MIFEWDRLPDLQRVDTLEDVAARTGFPMSDIEALIDSELDTPYLLDYIKAVVSNLMN
jgi:hypothetical protein